MKINQLFMTVASLVIFSILQLPQSKAQAPENAASNKAPLSSGTYFIVNAENLALTPLGPTAGQNVFLQPFNHGGTQQWKITRQPNTVNYTIKLNGSDAMFFQPHDIKDRTAIIDPGSQGISFRIQPVPGQENYWYIKSLKYNGDAMHSFVFSPELPVELRFDPAAQDMKYLWKFEPVQE